MSGTGAVEPDPDASYVAIGIVRNSAVLAIAFGRATLRRRWSASTPSHNKRRGRSEMTEAGVTLAARSIPVEMVTKPLSVFATRGRLPYRQRHFAAYRIGALVLVVLGLIGVIAIALLVLGLLDVHAVTQHFRIH